MKLKTTPLDALIMVLLLLIITAVVADILTNAMLIRHIDRMTLAVEELNNTINW